MRLRNINKRKSVLIFFFLFTFQHLTFILKIKNIYYIIFINNKIFI